MKVHAILAAFPRACPNAIKIACTTLLCALLVSGAAPQNELRFCMKAIRKPSTRSRCPKRIPRSSAT